MKERKLPSDCCNICLSNKSISIHEDMNGHRYVICIECGHVYQTSRREAPYYHTLPYESQWGSYLEHSKSRANYIADFCKGYIENTNKLVDIGSGPGGTMKYLKEKFPSLEVQGITSLSDKNIMVEKFKMKYGDFEQEVNLFVPDCDFAIMCHVMEHFINPSLALNKLNRLLKDGGLVYIEVPSFYWAEVRSNPQFCPVHLSYFSVSKLKYLLQQNGFNVIKIHESKFWGNIKVLARKETVECIEPLTEFWIPKLIKWQYNKLFIYRFYKIIKKLIKVSAND